MAEHSESFSHEARNGLITAIGIVLGFALGFFGTWSVNPAPWAWSDTPAVLLLMIGISVLTWALRAALLPYQQTVKGYEPAVKIFMRGIIIVLLGFLAAIFSDVLFKR